MRTRFEELLSDPCCASCDCDALASDVAAYLDRKTCDAEKSRELDQQPSGDVVGDTPKRARGQ